jgi:hypothetical protein
MIDRKLDIEVSEKIFGKKVNNRTGLAGIKLLTIEDENADWEVGCLRSNLPHYSGNMGDAWKVVEKMHELYPGINFNILKTFDWAQGPGLKFGASFDSYQGMGDYKNLAKAIEDTAPKAICLAALEAIKEIANYYE